MKNYKKIEQNIKIITFFPIFAKKIWIKLIWKNKKNILKKL